MTVVVYPGDALGLHLSYDAFFDDATAERLLADFKRLLAIGEHADGPFASCRWSTPPSASTCCRRAITDRDYPLADGYVRLFEAQHDAQHDAPGAGGGMPRSARWTYRELETRANRLGHALRAAEVDQPVALLAERSLALLGMMLGSASRPVQPICRWTRNCPPGVCSICCNWGKCPCWWPARRVAEGPCLAGAISPGATAAPGGVGGRAGPGLLQRAAGGLHRA